MSRVTRSRRSIHAGAALVAATLLLAAGCAPIRTLTYPADFVYLSVDDVSTGMHRLAAHMANVERLLDAGNGSPGGDAAPAMIRAVDAMIAVTRELGADASGTNHLLLDSHLDGFVEDLHLARQELASAPPRYYGAGKLVGGCNACHRYR